MSIIILTLLGSRPGEFIESSGWKDSNEGLLYRDVKLFRTSSDFYTGFLLHVQLRNRKGHRHNAKHGYATVYRYIAYTVLTRDSSTILLTEEPEDRSLCPVTYFLALALADGVFEGCTTMHDLEAKETPPGSASCSFKYKASVGDKPLLRRIEPDGNVSPDRILTYDCLNGMLKNLGQRAGYEDKLSAYCFRRGYGNAVDSK
jgi:hypothetical protein